jgi:hypothetical protein
MNRPVSYHAPDLIQNSLVNLTLLREVPIADGDRYEIPTNTSNAMKQTKADGSTYSLRLILGWHVYR